MTATDSLAARLADSGKSLAEARQMLDSARRVAERTIKNHPVAAISAGLGLGAILGWLIKRR